MDMDKNLKNYKQKFQKMNCVNNAYYLPSGSNYLFIIE